MALECEDLAPYGVVLIPPSTDRYFQLLGDIERTLQVSVKGSPPSRKETFARISEHDAPGAAILLNQAEVAIASLAYIWSFRARNGSILPHRFLPGTNPSVLLPFCLNDRTVKFNAFWHTIFPGSKRLMVADRHSYGDNTDVRAPVEDELWHGGFFSLGGGSMADQMEPVKLGLDGVFFADGGFAGPNQLGTWEHTTFAAEAYLVCAKLACETTERAASPSTFFAQVREFAGYQDNSFPPAPPHPVGQLDVDSIRKHERWYVGAAVTRARERLGDEGAIASIAAWSDAPAPNLHKL